jgi:uncharacterized protein with NAD-binding domain and iron-sulfur cluster
MPALAAAWDLTSRDNPVPCEVTVFQMGGRLGGKGPAVEIRMRETESRSMAFISGSVLLRERIPDGAHLLHGTAAGAGHR